MGKIFQLNSNNSNLENRCLVQTDLLITSIFGHFQHLFQIPQITTMYEDAIGRFELLMSEGYIIQGHQYQPDLDLWFDHTVKTKDNKQIDLILTDNAYNSLMGIQSMYKKMCDIPENLDKYDIYDDLTNEELFTNICYHQVEDFYRYLSNQKTKFQYPNRLKLLTDGNLSESDKFKLEYSNQLKFKPALENNDGTYSIQSGFIGFRKK